MLHASCWQFVRFSKLLPDLNSFMRVCSSPDVLRLAGGMGVQQCSNTASRSERGLQSPPYCSQPSIISMEGDLWTIYCCGLPRIAPSILDSMLTAGNSLCAGYCTRRELFSKVFFDTVVGVEVGACGLSASRSSRRNTLSICIPRKYS